MRVARILLAAAFISAAVMGSRTASPDASSGKVFVFPVTGEIERGLAFFLRRSLERAAREQPIRESAGEDQLGKPDNLKGA